MCTIKFLEIFFRKFEYLLGNNITMLRKAKETKLRLIQESNKRLMGEGHVWRHDIMKTIKDNVSELEMGQDMDTDYVESLIDKTIDELWSLRWLMSGREGK